MIQLAQSHTSPKCQNETVTFVHLTLQPVLHPPHLAPSFQRCMGEILQADYYSTLEKLFGCSFIFIHQF